MPKPQYQVVRTFHVANWIALIVGMLGVWHYSHSYMAVGFAFLASVHFVHTLKNEELLVWIVDQLIELQRQEIRDEEENEQ